MRAFDGGFGPRTGIIPDAATRGWEQTCFNNSGEVGMAEGEIRFLSAPWGLLAAAINNPLPELHLYL
jgi:hypothetical protein